MPTVERSPMQKTTSVTMSVIVTVLLAVDADAYAQGQRYSLSPRAPFPCGAVSFDGSNTVFRRTLVIVCDGKEQLEMPAGSRHKRGEMRGSQKPETRMSLRSSSTGSPHER